MNAESTNPWTLDEFVEQLNQSAPLPQGEDGRRAALWTPRLVRHYSSIKALSSPEKRGRQAYYGERHLDEAQRLTTLQQAGMPSKTAAWLMENQADESLLNASSVYLSSTENASSHSRSAATLSTLTSTGAIEQSTSDADAQGGWADSFAQPSPMFSPSLESQASEPAAETPPVGATPKSAVFAANASSRGLRSAQQMASASVAVNAMSAGPSLSGPFFGSISGAASPLMAAASSESTSGGGADNRKKALDLLDSFQGRNSARAPSIGAKSPIAAGRAELLWKKWSPADGLDISLREDLKQHEASLRALLDQWAKGLPKS